MKDVTGVIIGYVHRNTGEFMSTEQMNLRRADSLVLAVGGGR
jgi:hypothetical protein